MSTVILYYFLYKQIFELSCRTSVAAFKPELTKKSFLTLNDDIRLLWAMRISVKIKKLRRFVLFLSFPVRYTVTAAVKRNAC